MKYAEISKETISYLTQSYESIRQSPLDQTLVALIELRVSQINGCSYCCKLHSNEAREKDIPQEKLDCLMAWRTEPKLFTDKEKLALRWCDALTRLNNDDLKEIRKLLSQFFSDREIVDLTACIAIMNAFNRLQISLEG